MWHSSQPGPTLSRHFTCTGDGILHEDIPDSAARTEGKKRLELEPSDDDDLLARGSPNSHQRIGAQAAALET